MVLDRIDDFSPYNTLYIHSSTNDRQELGSPISVNRYGGFYENGKEFLFSKKWDVAVVYFRLWEANWPITHNVFPS